MVLGWGWGTQGGHPGAQGGDALVFSGRTPWYLQWGCSSAQGGDALAPGVRMLQSQCGDALIAGVGMPQSLVWGHVSLWCGDTPVCSGETPGWPVQRLLSP